MGKKRSISGRSISGSVLMELAITIPLLLLTVGGMVEIGRLYLQISRASQTTYLTVVEGTRAKPAIVSAQMQALAGKLISYENYDLTSPNLSLDTYDPITNLLTATFSGGVPVLWFPYVMGVSFTYTGSILNRFDLDLSPFSNFQNPPAGYNCDFIFPTAGSGPIGTPC